ncbi:MAG: M20 family metallo-hydrolase [Spirochaetaceae bacterium]|jgi:succinyl-diaminopimelate desuccinylase|nr:M20 family metallo-hydrolase [Spirochaetaceae bacterium]
MKKLLFNFIDGCRELAIELERSLTRIPAIAPDSGGDGELKKCEFLEHYLREQGVTNLERIDITDGRVAAGIRPNLIASIPGMDDTLPRLWIISHLDVVPPGEAKLWHSNPWELVEKNGKIYGRGVEDNQQGLTSAVLSALALIKNKITPRRTIKLLFAADEECASNYGIAALLKRDDELIATGKAPLFRMTDMAVIPDGGDSKGETIEVAEKHLLWIKFTTHGKQTHGSRPDEGVNAFIGGCDLALSLRHELSTRFDRRDPLFEPPCSTFEPTKKEANVPNTNTIPGEDVFSMDIRILPCYTVNEVLSEVERVIDRVQTTWRVHITYNIEQSVESKPTAADAPIVTMLTSAINDVFGRAARPIGIGGGTVGAFLRNRGIDAAVWSKLDDTAHNPNEYAIVDNILDDAKVMALLAVA